MIRILYAGSPEASCNTLKYLFENQEKYDFVIAGVLSNPPTAKGRHKELTNTPVAEFAKNNNIPYFTPEHLDSAARENVLTVQADLLVSFAYGHIFGPKFLSLFKFGGVNLHPSLLPKYRGCTPVPAAILNRDEKTAATIQTLSLKMDEGDILAQEIINLNQTETGEDLLNHAAEIGSKLICEVINKCNVENEIPEGKPQSGEPSYTKIITKDDGKIDWSQSAETIEAKIRAYYPDPSCWTLENNSPLKILKANYFSESDEKVISYKNEPVGKVVDYKKSDGIFIKTGDGVLCVVKLQRQGKNPMEYKDFMNGARNFVGTILE